MNNPVKCGNGSFIGDETEHLIVWRGIPYATQPVGELRQDRRPLHRKA